MNYLILFVGRPNVDWCEDHKVETIRTNVIGCLNVAGDTKKFLYQVKTFYTNSMAYYNKRYLRGEKAAPFIVRHWMHI